MSETLLQQEHALVSRAMMDDKGRGFKEAGPSTPVEILGLGDVPNAGEILLAFESDKEARTLQVHLFLRTRTAS